MCPNLDILVPALVEGGIDELEKRCALTPGTCLCYPKLFAPLALQQSIFPCPAISIQLAPMVIRQSHAWCVCVCGCVCWGRGGGGASLKRCSHAPVFCSLCTKTVQTAASLLCLETQHRSADAPSGLHNAPEYNLCSRKACPLVIRLRLGMPD